MKKNPDSPFDRAKLLIPLCLANTDEAEMAVLCRLVTLVRKDRSRKLTGPERQELNRILDEGEPIQAEGLLPFGRPRDERQSRAAYRPWNELLRWTLRRAIADAVQIDGHPIDEAVLRREKVAVRRILDAVIALPAEQNGIDALEGLFQKRLVHSAQKTKVLVDIDADRFRLLTLPIRSDLGAANTGNLVALFTRFPLSSLASCRQCRSYFVPGASGRTKTRGVIFCTDSCKRQWQNAQRSTS